jgi:uncharacterized protein
LTVSPGAERTRPELRSGHRPLGADRAEKQTGFDWASSSFRPNWRWWYAPAGLVLSHGLAYGINAALYFSGIRHLGVGRNLLLSVAVVELDALIIAVALLLASRTCTPRPQDFGLRRPVGPRVGRAIALAWFAGRLAAIAGALLTRGRVSSPRAHGALAIALDAVIVVAVAPIAEEVFYRGFFYGSLRTRLPILPAALATGLLFGAVHVFGDGYPPGVALGIGLNGVIWCLLYEYTGSLWPSIVLHSYLNATAIAARYGPSLLLPALAAFIVAIFLLRKAARRPRGLRDLRTMPNAVHARPSAR